MSLVSAVAVLSACDDKEDETSTSTSPLVGYWCNVDRDEGPDGSTLYFYEVFIFENNGSYRVQYWDSNDTEITEEYGTYTYNARSNELTTNTLVGEKPGKYTCTARISGQTLFIEEPDGDSYSYERITAQEYRELIDLAL